MSEENKAEGGGRGQKERESSHSAFSSADEPPFRSAGGEEEEEEEEAIKCRAIVCTPALINSARYRRAQRRLRYLRMEVEQRW